MVNFAVLLNGELDKNIPQVDNNDNYYDYDQNNNNEELDEEVVAYNFIFVAGLVIILSLIGILCCCCMIKKSNNRRRVARSQALSHYAPQNEIAMSPQYVYNPINSVPMGGPVQIVQIAPEHQEARVEQELMDEAYARHLQNLDQ